MSTLTISDEDFDHVESSPEPLPKLRGYPEASWAPMHSHIFSTASCLLTTVSLLIKEVHKRRHTAKEEIKW